MYANSAMRKEFNRVMAVQANQREAYFAKLDAEWAEVWEEFDAEFFNDGVFTQAIAMIQSPTPIVLQFPIVPREGQPGWNMYQAYQLYLIQQ